MSDARRARSGHAILSGMKRIKQIIEALRVTSTSPALAISDAREAIMGGLSTNAPWTEQQRTLIDNILAAVIDFAEFDARAAAKTRSAHGSEAA